MGNPTLDQFIPIHTTPKLDIAYLLQSKGSSLTLGLSGVQRQLQPSTADYMLGFVLGQCLGLQPRTTIRPGPAKSPAIVLDASTDDRAGGSGP